MQRDRQFLLDMLQSAELIITYTAQCSKAEFVDNVQLQDSVIRRLLVSDKIQAFFSNLKQNFQKTQSISLNGMLTMKCFPMCNEF